MHDEVRVLTSFNLTIGFKRKFQFSGGHSQIIWRRFMTKRLGNWQSVPKPGFYPPSSKETREKATQLQAGVSGESWPLDWVNVHQVLTGYMWVVANPGLGENITGHFGGVQSVNTRMWQMRKLRQGSDWFEVDRIPSLQQKWGLDLVFDFSFNANWHIL